ncbi:MAG: hypothetical protein P8185_03845 [Deltaproteobacteria bacterium]|jgi:hypothetical protein
MKASAQNYFSAAMRRNLESFDLGIGRQKNKIGHFPIFAGATGSAGPSGQPLILKPFQDLFSYILEYVT